MDAVHNAIAWYQKKIGSYDKQLWEQSVEKKLQKAPHFVLNNAPRRSVRLKTQYIDIDLIRGSTFTKTKPQVPWVYITRKAIARVLFFPFYYSWWAHQTSPKLYAALLVLYVLQVVTVIVYLRNFDHSITEDELSFTEVILPAILMFLLCLIHSQTVLAHISHKPPKRSKGLASVVRKPKPKKTSRKGHRSSGNNSSACPEEGTSNADPTWDVKQTNVLPGALNSAVQNQSLDKTPLNELGQKFDTVSGGVASRLTESSNFPSDSHTLNQPELQGLVGEAAKKDAPCMELSSDVTSPNISLCAGELKQDMYSSVSNRDREEIDSQQTEEKDHGFLTSDRSTLKKFSVNYCKQTSNKSECQSTGAQANNCDVSELRHGHQSSPRSSHNVGCSYNLLDNLPDMLRVEKVYKDISSQSCCSDNLPTSNVQGRFAGCVNSGVIIASENKIPKRASSGLDFADSRANSEEIQGCSHSGLVIVGSSGSEKVNMNKGYNPVLDENNLDPDISSRGLPKNLHRDVECSRCDSDLAKTLLSSATERCETLTSDPNSHRLSLTQRDSSVDSPSGSDNPSSSDFEIIYPAVVSPLHASNAQCTPQSYTNSTSCTESHCGGIQSKHDSHSVSSHNARRNSEDMIHSGCLSKTDPIPHIDQPCVFSHNTTNLVYQENDSLLGTFSNMADSHTPNMNGGRCKDIISKSVKDVQVSMDEPVRQNNASSWASLNLSQPQVSGYSDGCLCAAAQNEAESQFQDTSDVGSHKAARTSPNISVQKGQSRVSLGHEVPVSSSGQVDDASSASSCYPSNLPQILIRGASVPDDMGYESSKLEGQRNSLLMSESASSSQLQCFSENFVEEILNEHTLRQMSSTSLLVHSDLENSSSSISHLSTTSVSSTSSSGSRKIMCQDEVKEKVVREQRPDSERQHGIASLQSRFDTKLKVQQGSLDEDRNLLDESLEHLVSDGERQSDVSNYNPSESEPDSDAPVNDTIRDRCQEKRKKLRFQELSVPGPGNYGGATSGAASLGTAGPRSMVGILTRKLSPLKDHPSGRKISPQAANTSGSEQEQSEARSSVRRRRRMSGTPTESTDTCRARPSTLGLRTGSGKGKGKHLSSSETETGGAQTPEGSTKATMSSEEWEDGVQSDETTSSAYSSSCGNSDTEDREDEEEKTEYSTSTLQVINLLHPQSGSPTSSGHTSQPDKVSCVIWEGNECKKVDLTALDIGWAIIDKVDSLPESSDYFFIGFLFSVIMCTVPLAFRVFANRDLMSWDSFTALTNFTWTWDIGCKLWDLVGLSTIYSWRQNLLMVNGIIQRFCLSLLFFFLLTVADRTFKQRLLYAKHFSYLTSSRRARKFSMPHFRLNKVRNIKIWLSLRSYLKRRGPQRSVDVIVSACFLSAISTVCLISLQMLKDTDSYLDFLCNWELLVWCIALGVFLMRFMTIGLKINKKYRNLSVLITEQINLYLQMEQKPHKKEELILANNVLRLAEDLLKELESPFKISGFSANPLIYNIMRVVVLSAFSAVLTEVLGFKLKLHKIKLKG